MDSNIFDRMYKCECHTEALNFISFIDEDSQFPKQARHFYVTLWTRGREGNKWSWLHRLEHIWKILTKGDPYHDEIVLREDVALEFANDIVEQSKKRDEAYEKYLKDVDREQGNR